MILEQKLAISRYGLKKAIKIAKNGGFPWFWGVKKFKNRKNDYSYLITSTSCKSCANFKSFRLIPHYCEKKSEKKNWKSEKGPFGKKTFWNFFLEIMSGKIFFRGIFFFEIFFFSKTKWKKLLEKFLKKNCWFSNNFT